MPYIGKTPTQGVRQRYMYTATAGQTTFSGTDTQNLTLSYSDSNFIDVYQNGVLLKTGTDYTATSGTSVVLTTGASVSDVVEMIVYDVFASADFFNRTDSDSRYVNIDGDTMTGALTGTTATFVGANTLTLRNDTSTDADEPKLIFDNDTFSGANHANITTGNGGLLMKIESPSTSTYQNRHQILMNAGAGDDIQFNSSTNNGSSYTTQMKIEAGNVTIGDGNLVIGTSGHGIDFSATGDGSGTDTSELLDDYEEGTWTPLVRGSTTAGTASYSTQIGRYTKIGNLIHVNFVLQYSITSAAGDLEITGFPYSGSGSEPNDVGVLQHNQAGASYASGVASYVPYMSSAVMSFRGNKSDGTSFVSLAIQNMSYMRVTFVYTQG